MIKTTTPKQFSHEIENIVSHKNMAYMDAIVFYCEKNSIEVESIATLVNQNANLKAKLYEECMELNLVEKIATLRF